MKNSFLFKPLQRKKTIKIMVGNIAVGGDAPVSVQTMTKTDTCDIKGTIKQIQSVASAGCDIIRVAVPDRRAAQAIKEIKKEITIPLVADIHFDYRLAISSLEAGADAIRINPGNIGSREKIKEVVKAAVEHKSVIRIGVNSGSLEKDIMEKHKGVEAEALVESALRHIQLMEDMNFKNIKISVKASDPLTTVQAYKLLSEKTRYPLHVGVTEAGTFLPGVIRSSVAIGVLLWHGIGDTIRVSLTDTPEREVRAGIEILRALGLRKDRGGSIISCPTCGRVQVDVISIAGKVEELLEKYYRENPKMPRPRVAVMGCVVNGPGEAKEADIALAGGKGKFALYVRGKLIKTVEEKQAINALMKEVGRWGK